MGWIFQVNGKCYLSFPLELPTEDEACDKAAQEALQVLSKDEKTPEPKVWTHFAFF